MRNDARIDRKYVACPNASTLGYGKWKAQTGDIVVYRQATYEAKDLKEMTNPYYSSRVGRVIGRIAHAPNLDEYGKTIRNYLLIVGLSEDLTAAMERWVNPVDVTRVYDPRETNTQALISFFFSPEMPKEPVNILRQWSTSGFSTVQEYREYLSKRS